MKITLQVERQNIDRMEISVMKNIKQRRENAERLQGRPHSGAI